MPPKAAARRTPPVPRSSTPPSLPPPPPPPPVLPLPPPPPPPGVGCKSIYIYPLWGGRGADGREKGGGGRGGRWWEEGGGGRRREGIWIGRRAGADRAAWCSSMSFMHRTCDCPAAVPSSCEACEAHCPAAVPSRCEAHRHATVAFAFSARMLWTSASHRFSFVYAAIGVGLVLQNGGRGGHEVGWRRGVDHEVGLGWHCKAEWLLHLYPCSYEQLIAMPPRFRIASLWSFSLTLVHSFSDYCKHSYLYEPTANTYGDHPRQ